MNFSRFAMLLLFATLCCPLFAGEPVKPPVPPAPPAKPPLPPVTEEELQRVARTSGGVFPWKANPQPKVPAVPKDPKDPGADSGVPDLTSGEIIIKSLGDFSREEKDGKEILTLNKDVEIEQLQTQSVLRGQTIRVVRDLKTGQTELLEAHGGVEVVTPERKGRGEKLLYETQFGPQGQILKDLYTIEGDAKHGIRATLWQGDDVIVADRFINDRKMDTFRVTGGPQAIITMPTDSNAPADPKPAPTGGGMLPGFGTGGGGKIRMKADGEMFYEGATGRVHITRNVILQQDGVPPDPGMKMTSDDAWLTLSLPPPGQPASTTSVFSGSLKSLECLGRVEIITASQTVYCDRGFLDMVKNTFLMEMKNPKDTVLVYMKEKAMKLIAPKNLVVNMQTSEFHSAGALKMESFTGTPPSSRNPAPPAPAPVPGPASAPKTAPPAK